MNLWIKLALKELRNHRRFSLFFILNLMLGLVGFLILDSFRASLDHYFTGRSKAILTADIGIQSTRPFQDEELEEVGAVLGAGHEEVRQTTFFHMISTKGRSRLVQIVGVSEKFPFYGDLILSRQGKVTPELAKRDLYDGQAIWVFPEVLISLGVRVGDVLKIGNGSYRIVDTIADEPPGAFNTFGMAPKVYIGLNQIEATGLIKPGSRAFYYLFYKFASPLDEQALAVFLRERLQERFGTALAIQVITPQDASERVSRALVHIGDYLGLTALVALFLAGIGTAYLFRSYFNSRLKEVAILMSLGAYRNDALKVLLCQVVILGVCAAVIANTLAFVLMPLLPALLQDFLPKGFETLLRPGSFVLAGFMGSVGSVLFCVPILINLRDVEPAWLFHETGTMIWTTGRWTLRNWVSYQPGLAAFWGLAIWQAKSFLVGSIFIGLFLAAAGILGAVIWLVFAGIDRISLKSVVFRLAFRSMSRNKMSVTASFLAISLGALLLNVIPQLHKGLNEEINQPEGHSLPSFFLFDIQPEQIEPLQTYLDTQGYPMRYVSPIIRARLETVNGNPPALMPENRRMNRGEESEQRLRRYGMNLTYRVGSYPSEDIVEGRRLKDEYDLKADQPAEISVEVRYAERLGYEVGDVLGFDVQGIAVESRIVNLRRVKWNNFQPNFFILFQPGVLEEAPKSFLASVSGVSLEQKPLLQNGIVQQFPNVSMIDVARLVERVLQLTRQLSFALQFMAILSIVAGLVVVFSIARHEVHTRIREINLLKVLGGSFQEIRRIFLIEFGVIGGTASLCGVILSFAMSYSIAELVFESIWSFSWQFGLVSIGLVGGLSILASLSATWRVLRQKPLNLLQAV
jgi:putative ABC transport system permease protein